MLIKDELIQLITQLVTPPAEAWKSDPFEILLKQCPKEVFDKFVDPTIEDPTPSTSDGAKTVNADARAHYSRILGGLFLELAGVLESQRATTDDEYQLISLQEIAIIKDSFQFFLLTGVIPFLEPGVCLPASARSTFIKSWKVYDGNKEACAEKLDFAAKVIAALLKCNDAIASQFLKKFIDDVIAVQYQLNELKANNYEAQLEQIISKCPVDLLFGSLMFLSRGGKSAEPPMWLKGACGRTLSKILVAEGGLALMLQYYQERAGDNWTDHLPMTKSVAWCLAAVPKIFSHPRKYHENISNQFFEIIWSQKEVDKNTLNLFVSYVNEVHVRFSLNADLTVFDKILNFWELLDKKLQNKEQTHTEKIEGFSKNDIRNLQLLSQMQNSYNVKRIRQLTTCFFACAEQIPYIKDILRAILDSVGSLGYTIYQYVITPSLAVRLVKKSVTSAKIQEVGETNGNETPSEELWVDGFSDSDESVAHRIDTAFYVIDNVLTAARVRTIMEMINVALEEFLKVSEKEREDDMARFVQLDGAKLFSSTHSHFIVGCCYERLIAIAGERGFAQDECIQLLRITENILNNATLKFVRMANRKQSVDVFQMTETEVKEFDSTRSTVRLCIPLITAIFSLTRGASRMQEIATKALEAIANFTKASDLFPSSDVVFNNTIDETKRYLKTLKIDVNDVVPPVVPQRNERRRYNQIDLCNEWIEELHDDEPAVKGGALMQISKAFRQRTWHCQKLIEYGAYDTVKDMVIDDDSYVFLSAINCLCEMALYDRHFFEGLIEYYEELINATNKDEKLVIRIGRTAEAVGKLLISRGESSITFFDRLATAFMTGIEASDEILRASSCGAFGNLLVATRGRGVEKWLDQMLLKVTNILRIDRSPQVRRSATDLIRHSLKAAGKDILVILRESLLDLHREVRNLWKTDRDETVRLHAQLCCEEIDAALRTNQEESERGYHRKIRF
ncbi:unnamed protein product [Caenorhabditis nigoni]